MRVSDRFTAVPDVFFDDETRRAARRLVEGLGAAHVVLPEQFVERPADDCGPCKLHRGLLADAVEQLLLTLRPSRNPSVARCRKRHRAELLAWFAGADAPITFATCAELVGRQPAELRAKILTLIINDGERGLKEVTRCRPVMLAS